MKEKEKEEDEEEEERERERERRHGERESERLCVVSDRVGVNMYDVLADFTVR